MAEVEKAGPQWQVRVSIVMLVALCSKKEVLAMREDSKEVMRVVVARVGGQEVPIEVVIETAEVEVTEGTSKAVSTETVGLKAAREVASRVEAGEVPMRLAEGR